MAGGVCRGVGGAVVDEVRAVDIPMLEPMEVVHELADPEQRDVELLPVLPVQPAPLDLHPLHPGDGLQPLRQHERTIRQVEGVRREFDDELVDADAPGVQDLLQRCIEPHDAGLAVAGVAFVADAQRRLVEHRSILRRGAPQLLAPW